MASLAYKGSITTTGSSEAIRIDKTLFRQNPEFRQKARVDVHVIGHGTMLVHVVDDQPLVDDHDPMVAAFLSFIERDAMANPGNVGRFTDAQLSRSTGLTANVIVSDDDAIPDDVTF